MAEPPAGDQGVVLPEGTVNVFIQNKNLEKYGLLKDPSGEILPDNFPDYKFLNRQNILEQCQSLGFMCDFHSFMAQLQGLEDEEILLLVDRQQKYGDFWRLCLTSEAKEREFAIIEAEVREKEAKIRDAEEAEAKRLAEIEALAKVEFVDKPIVARKYASETKEETAADVDALTIKPDREFLKIAVMRDVSTFGLPCVFGDREADNDKYLEHRSHKNPDFELQKIQSDVGVSVAPTYKCNRTQTTWYRRQNRFTIYSTADAHLCTYGDPLFSNDDDVNVDDKQHRSKFSKSSSRPGTGTSQISTARSAGAFTAKQRAEMRLGSFVTNARALIEDALQQNETVDVFKAAFDDVGDDDTGNLNEGNKRENELKELRTFNDIVYSKNMSLAGIAWHPTHKGMLAVAPVRNMDFDERIAASGHAVNSYILVWDFVDLIHPQLTLESPQEITCFAFSKDLPNIVAAGAMNGQILLWDVEAPIAALVRRRHRSSVARSEEDKKKISSEDDDDDDDTGAGMPPVAPTAVAFIDTTHRRAVADLVWLPAKCQVDYRGQILSAEHTEGPSYQFLTVSGDGQVLFWDTRFRDIADGKFPHIGRRVPPDRKEGSGGSKHTNTTPWVPLYRVQLKRLEGVGELSLCKVCHGLKPPTGDPRSQLLCASEEGEFVFADWRPNKKAKADSSSKDEKKSKDDDDDDDDEAPEYVQWMAADHWRPAVSLEVSPFFWDVVLSVGDWNFQLWKLDHTKEPIFSSPQAASSLTAGCWSPTRPGTLYVARSDGAVDVWDLTDSSYRPAASLMLAPTRITSLSFLAPDLPSATSKQQLLAVGDKAGNLHVFDVPRNLWRPAPNEKALMANFIDGEVGTFSHSFLVSHSL